MSPTLPRSLLEADDKEVVVDATYFLVRMLRHRVPGYTGLLPSIESAPGAQWVAESALREIEAVEDRPLSEMSPVLIGEYIVSLEEMLQVKYAAYVGGDPPRAASILGEMRETLVPRVREPSDAAPPPEEESVLRSRSVYLVSGADRQAEEAVVRFLDRLGLEVLSLRDVGTPGFTILEQLAASARANYAIALLTPDELLSGAPTAKRESELIRASPNVMLELGFMLAKLGSQNVCVLVKGTLALPSDLLGVLYVPLDREGAWESRVAQALVNSGLVTSYERE